MSARLSRELDKLKQSLLQLSTLVEESFQASIKAFESMDVDKAKQLVLGDRKIDQMEIDVEEECLKIMALYQPVAKDLRFIVSILKITNDLERIGDLASNIGKRVIKLSSRGVRVSGLDFSEMMEKARLMLKLSLDSLVNLDSEMARRVVLMDDEVDEWKSILKRQIKEKFYSESENSGMLMHNLSIVYSIERVGDLSTNIAEDVIYLIEGIIVRHNSRLLSDDLQFNQQ